MAEDRMLNDEILLGLIKANSGGGGGTTDYEDLNNLPKINSVELKGNKSLSDLGIQNALTAGDYIQFDGNEISVNRNIEVENVDYNIKYVNNNTASITKSKDGQVISTQSYDWGIYETSIDGLFYFGGASSSIGFVWRITLIKDSTTHNAGYSVDFKTNDTTMDITESFPEQDVSGYKLVIKSEMDTALAGKQDILTFDDTPTDNSNNPVKSNGIYDALALKQNATDNSLDTTAKTIVGAINEHEGDVASLKSGLTTLDNEVNGDATTYPYADVITIEDAVPSNLADCTVKIEPEQDLHGYDKPWVGGAGKNICPPFSTQTISDVTLTWDANTGTAVLNGTNNTESSINFTIPCDRTVAGTEYWLNGAPSDALDSTYYMYVQKKNYTNQKSDRGSGVSFNYDSDGCRVFIRLAAGATANNVVFKPMVCLNSETDKSFAPYENICPISGHTEASVQRDGNDVWTGNDSYIIATAGHIIPNTTIALPAGKYALDFEASNPSGVFEFEVFKGNSVDLANRLFDKVFTAKARNIVEFTLTEASTNLRLYSSNGASISNVRLYSTVETYTIALGDTIYGGTVDFDSGVMRVTHADMDMGSVTWTAVGATPHLYQYTGMQSNVKKPSSNDDVVDSYCECYAVVSANTASAGTNGFAITTGGTLRIYDDVVSDATALNAELSGMHLIYELATPLTVQLTPQQIQLLKGQNTISASTGQISVTVNGVSGSIGSLQTQANDTDAALAELAADIAEKLPTAPTTDGAYVLTVTVADGTPTYSWESAT